MTSIWQTRVSLVSMTPRLAEVVANVALNVFTNYFNHVAETDIDFPKVEPIVDHHEVCASIPGCDETR